MLRYRSTFCSTLTFASAYDRPTANQAELLTPSQDNSVDELGLDFKEIPPVNSHKSTQQLDGLRKNMPATDPQLENNLLLAARRPKKIIPIAHLGLNRKVVAKVDAFKPMGVSTTETQAKRKLVTDFRDDELQDVEGLKSTRKNARRTSINATGTLLGRDDSAMMQIDDANMQTGGKRTAVKHVGKVAPLTRNGRRRNKSTSQAGGAMA